MSTKERILQEALTLFAENGYDGTGVEQIAEKVGIKAPSLYKHFKGKEDILNALIDSAEEYYEESFGSEQHIGEIPENRDDFVRATMSRIAFTMHDPMYEKIIEEMMKNGLFLYDDPALLSIELVSPVVLWVSKADRQPQYEREIMECIKKHIIHFCDVYMKE